MRIIISGCGPKALAIYAKMQGLKHAGFKVPEIVILEKYEVAAHWRGKGYGFTDGDQPLGTPPEKDIGYPYNSVYKNYGATDINAFLFKFSWPAYIIEQGSYADLTDRDWPAPQHKEWAAYLRWAAKQLQLKGSASYINGELHRVVKKDNQWLVQYTSTDSLGVDPSEIECDALVITGPGEPKRLKYQAAWDENIMNGRSFWTESSITRFKSWDNQNKKIAVIGAGETAASIICGLVKFNPASTWTIDVISRRGTLYSRGEGYHENRFFSDPQNWGTLPPNLREEVIERTDRGVLSLKAIRVITDAKNVRCTHGNVVGITWNGRKVKVTLEGETEPGEYDCVIVALGFDPLSFRDYFANAADLGLVIGENNADSRSRGYLKACAQLISEDLSVFNLAPKLYLPMLAGLTQGPGFPNLSCLGLLSDRILRHSITTLNPEKMGK
jgi:mycobactin lysine-N-oxygenase